jgi:hypothetical protein
MSPLPQIWQIPQRIGFSLANQDVMDQLQSHMVPRRAARHSWFDSEAILPATRLLQGGSLQWLRNIGKLHGQEIAAEADKENDSEKLRQLPGIRQE